MLFVRNARVVFALLLIGATLALRWPVLHRQIWNLDEGSTITMAQQVLDGQVLFRDAADNRTPLVPYVKALILAVAGNWNTWAIHFTLAVMIGLTAVLLWRTCRRLGHERVGVFSALAFTGLSTGLITDVDSLTAHTGWYLIFFSALGFWVFSHALTRQSRLAACVSGVGFGLAMLAKQPGLIDFGVTVIVVLLLALGREKRSAWRLLPFMVAGFCVPLAVTFVYFQANHALADLKFYAWTYNTQYYVPEVPLMMRLAAIRVPYQLFTERMPVAFGLALAGVLGLLWLVMIRERREPARAALAWLTLGWAASGLLSTTLSGREFAHYSIQVLPGAALVCGWSLAWLWDRAGRVRWITRAAVAGALLSLAVQDVRMIAAADTNDGYGPELGQIIQRNSRPEERMFIWGYMPELYVFSRRLPSTRFIYTNWITGFIPWTNSDFLTDTTYAIIPGTAEQLRQDLEKHPPAIVVDTGALRTYLKYPLSGQGWLWRKVLGEFAEIEPAAGSRLGFRIYRRVASAAPGAFFPANVPLDARLRLELPAESRSEDVRVTVHYPAGTRSLELYKDGALYRRLELISTEAGAAVFHVLKTDLSLGQRQFQALARGTGMTASHDAFLQVTPARPHKFAGPMLEFGGSGYAPLIATNGDGVMTREPGEGLWNAQAPARIVYERPPGLVGVEFEYKMGDVLVAEPRRWHTDGVDVVVQFEDKRGKRTELYRRHLDARFNQADQGLQRQQVTLPPDEPGRVTVWFSPGRASDSSCDWVQLKAIRGIGVPVSLAFRDRQIFPARISAPFGLARMNDGDLEATLAHAPSEIEFELRPGMRRLTGIFGMVSSAWTGPKGSVGATFEVWHLPANGKPSRLYQAQLDPVHVAKDRERQTLLVPLPSPAEGRIRLMTLPTHPEDNSFNHTYWAALTAEGSPPVITRHGSALEPEKVVARFGYSEMEYQQRWVLYAHAPSEIVCRPSADVRHLTGSFGLIDQAYAGSERCEGARFVVEGEYANGQRVELWSRELDPQNRPEDRGFISFSLPVPPDDFERLVFRTDARPGHGLSRAWTFWHDLRLDP